MTPTVQTQRRFSWYRFESRSTRSTSRKIPFELFYLIPDYQVKEFGRLYEVFLGFKMSPKFLEDFMQRAVGEYRCSGMGRFESYKKETAEDPALEHNLSEEAKANLSSSIMMMCVPVLAKRVGDQVYPSYMLNRGRVKELTLRQEAQSKRSVNRTSTPTDLDQMLHNMAIYTNGEEKIPCAICTWGIRKVVNDRHCSLGTASCLSKINLSGVDTFTEKAGRSVTPADYVETHNETPS